MFNFNHKELIIIDNGDGDYIKARVYKCPYAHEGESMMVSDFISLFPYIKIVEVLDIYVNKDNRRKGVGSLLLQDLIDRCKHDSVILVSAGASSKEYEEEPSEEELKKIVKDIIPFYAENGFVSINNDIGNYQFKEAMMYSNNAMGRYFLAKINNLKGE